MSILFIAGVSLMLIGMCLSLNIPLYTGTLVCCILLSLVFYWVCRGKIISPGDIYINNSDNTKVIVDDVVNNEIFYHFIDEGWNCNVYVANLNNFNQAFSKCQED